MVVYNCYIDYRRTVVDVYGGSDRALRDAPPELLLRPHQNHRNEVIRAVMSERSLHLLHELAGWPLLLPAGAAVRVAETTRERHSVKPRCKRHTLELKGIRIIVRKVWTHRMVWPRRKCFSLVPGGVASLAFWRHLRGWSRLSL